jgi:hypothetical protein
MLFIFREGRSTSSIQFGMLGLKGALKQLTVKCEWLTFQFDIQILRKIKRAMTVLECDLFLPVIETSRP